MVVFGSCRTTGQVLCQRACRPPLGRRCSPAIIGRNDGLGADLVWEYHTGPVAANDELLSIAKVETIPQIYLFSAPNVGNTTYYNTPNNPQAASANVGQCTWYVYGRIQETDLISAQTLSNLGIFLGGASTWHSDAISSKAVAAGFTTGSQPKACGAIAYWNAGHVAFVEDSSGNVTESNNDPANGYQAVIDGYVGYPYVKLHQSADAASTTLWTIPQFTVMNVTGSPQTAGGYQWYPMSANDGNPNHTGWAALLDANTGWAATHNYIWNFTRIQTHSIFALAGVTDTFIFRARSRRCRSTT